MALQLDKGVRDIDTNRQKKTVTNRKTDRHTDQKPSGTWLIDKSTVLRLRGLWFKPSSGDEIIAINFEKLYNSLIFEVSLSRTGLSNLLHACIFLHSFKEGSKLNAS